MNMPRFTAETSLYRTKTNYRKAGAHAALPVSGRVVPQQLPVTACSGCSGFLRGTRYCCDVRITCDPYGGCTTFQLCHTEACGLLPWLEGIFGTAFRG